MGKKPKKRKHRTPRKRTRKSQAVPPTAPPLPPVVTAPDWLSIPPARLDTRVNDWMTAAVGGGLAWRRFWRKMQLGELARVWRSTLARVGDWPCGLCIALARSIACVRAIIHPLPSGVGLYLPLVGLGVLVVPLLARVYARGTLRGGI